MFSVDDKYAEELSLFIERGKVLLPDAFRSDLVLLEEQVAAREIDISLVSKVTELLHMYICSKKELSDSDDSNIRTRAEKRFLRLLSEDNDVLWELYNTLAYLIQSNDLMMERG